CSSDLEDQRLAVGVLELAEELTGLRVKGANVAVAEVADQQVAAEVAEAGRREGGADGRVERGECPSRGRPRGKTLQEVPAGVELVDEAVAWPGHIVVLGGILFGVGDEQGAV